MAISTEPFVRTLYGLSGTFRPRQAWETFKPLMDRLWATIRSGVKTEGINHVVYQGRGTLFVGVVLSPGQAEPAGLEKKEVRMAKYAIWTHRGNFSDIPKGYRILQEEVMKSGATEGPTSVEIYGHVDPSDPLSEMQVLLEIR